MGSLGISEVPTALRAPPGAPAPCPGALSSRAGPIGRGGAGARNRSQCPSGARARSGRCRRHACYYSARRARSAAPSQWQGAAGGDCEPSKAHICHPPARLAAGTCSPRDAPHAPRLGHPGAREGGAARDTEKSASQSRNLGCGGERQSPRFPAWQRGDGGGGSCKEGVQMRMNESFRAVPTASNGEEPGRGLLPASQIVVACSFGGSAACMGFVFFFFFISGRVVGTRPRDVSVLPPSTPLFPVPLPTPPICRLASVLWILWGLMKGSATVLWGSRFIHSSTCLLFNHSLSSSTPNPSSSYIF